MEEIERSNMAQSEWWVWEETSAAGRGFGPFPTQEEAQAFVDEAYDRFPEGQSSLKVRDYPYPA